MVKIKAYELSEKGGRSENEDTVYNCQKERKQAQLDQKGYLYIVADGVGGRKGGVYASRRAVTVASDYYYQDDNSNPIERLHSAVLAAQKAVCQEAEDNPGRAHMSTTFVGAVIYGDRLYLAHVGDSRAYLVKDSKAKLLAEDDIWTADDENQGKLTRWLGKGGINPDLPNQIEIINCPLQRGDVIVLCSDGLTDQDFVRDEEIQAYASREEPDIAVQELVKLALERKTTDNVSVVVVRYGEIALMSARRVAWKASRFLAPIIIIISIFLLGRNFHLATPIVSESGTGTSPVTLGSVTSQQGITPSSTNGIYLYTPTPLPIASSREIPRVFSPTSTRMPTSTLTPVKPTPKSTPTPRTSTPAPTQVAQLMVGRLVSPLQTDTITTGKLACFSWKWDGQLPKNTGFEIRIWLEDVDPIHFGAADVRHTEFRQVDGIYQACIDVAAAESVRRHQTRDDYRWTVAVVQIEPYRRLGPEAKPLGLSVVVPDPTHDNHDEGRPPDEGSIPPDQ